MDPEVVQKLLIRLQHLCQLEAFLVHAVEFVPPCTQLATPCGKLVPVLPTRGQPTKVMSYRVTERALNRNALVLSCRFSKWSLNCMPC